MDSPQAAFRSISSSIIAPLPGTILTMVNNTGLGFIHGRFANLAQGQRVSLAACGWKL